MAELKPFGWLFIPKMKGATTIKVDHREIVLCRDCVHWDHGANESCTWSDCLIHHHYVQDNDFCSWAENKEETDA